MSILSSFKKALGFPDEYDDELDDNLDDNLDTLTQRESPALQRRNDTAKAPETIDKAPAPADEMPQPIAPELPGEIFDAVIELFNASQPDFVRQCLNVESQRAYLMERIDKSLKDKLEKETTNARRRGELLWEEEKRKMTGDIDRLKSEYHSLKQQREEFQSAQLSAARQKRALKERVNDLESQVGKLEAEREQLQLENRSMLNKLRVANVRASADGNTEAEFQRIAQENVMLQDRINGLCDDKKKADAEIAALNKTIDELRDQADTDNISAEQQTALKEIEERIRMFEDVKARKDKKIDDLTVQNRQLAAETKTLTARLSEANKASETLITEIESLKKTAALQASSSAETEQSLRDEVKRLTELLNATEVPIRKRPGRKPKDRHSRRIDIPDTGNHVDKDSNADALPDKSDEKNATMTSETKTGNETGTVKISAIDELMDSTDWFIAPDPMPVKKDPEVEEDFGYKEPPARRATRDDDKQLSLF